MQYVYSKIVVTIIILLFAGISLHAATSEVSAAEGRGKIVQWVRGDGHNQYGRSIELSTSGELTVYLNRMDPIAKTFQTHLAGAAI